LNSLKLAVKHSIAIMAFPNISTGVYGYPKQAAAEIAVSTVSKWLESHTLPEKVIFVLYDEENADIYKRLLS
jgi:O-acetyl-ADP-ribose deacetylase (regulator of RNase III)